MQSTYNLEGNDPLVLSAYRSCISLQFKFATLQIRMLSFVSFVCVQQGFDYFTRGFQVELSGTLVAFKAARLLSPHNVCALHPDASSVDNLRVFPF